MNLAYVCNEYPPAPHGGIGTFVQTMARAMHQAGHGVMVVGMGQEGRSWTDRGVRVTTLSRTAIPGTSGIVDRLRVHRWLRTEARAGRIDIVEIPEYEGFLPLPFRSCPVVVRLHLSATSIAIAQGRRPNWLRMQCEASTLKQHPHWIGVSAYALQLTRRTFGSEGGQSVVIHDPVSLPPASDCLDLPRQFVLFAGTVCVRKGAYVLAEAASMFLRADPELHLVFIGPLAEEDGTRADRRIYQIVGPELSQRVHFFGRVERSTAVRCMQEALLFAFPSTLETFGLVTAEAMLAGTPVIIADAGPARELVTDGQTGILVPPHDSVALARAVVQLVKDPALRQSLAAAGRHRAETGFSVAACVSASVELYRRALEWQQGAQASPARGCIHAN